jgi:hypothetical protein
MDERRFFHLQADECRRAADDMAHSFERRALRQLARHYEQEARRLSPAQMDGVAFDSRRPKA